MAAFSQKATHPGIHIHTHTHTYCTNTCIGGLIVSRYAHIAESTNQLITGRFVRTYVDLRQLHSVLFAADEGLRVRNILPSAVTPACTQHAGAPCYCTMYWHSIYQYVPGTACHASAHQCVTHWCRLTGVDTGGLPCFHPNTHTVRTHTYTHIRNSVS